MGDGQFDQKTVMEFKEAFGIMDGNKDGIIDKNDLKDLYASMGQLMDDKVLEAMVKEAGEKINFTVFLSLFGNKLTGTDSFDMILEAFKKFDPQETGKLNENELIRILKFKKGNPLTDAEVDAMYKGKPPIDVGFCDYEAFAKLMTTGGDEV